MHKYYILYFLLLLSVTINAQETFFATGLEIDEETCSTIPQVPSLVTRDYVVLPVSHSLQQYCPTPRSQREFGTCTSWAVGYAARTIAEAVRNNWTDKELIDKEAFSPLFVYAQIKHTDDHECQRGTDPGAAMSIMKKKGIPKLSSFDVFCAEYISKDLFEEAANYKIDNYFQLFSKFTNTVAKAKILKIKKAISEDCPVVIAMNVYPSFQKAEEDWNGDCTGTPGSHAMCVVGYDDERLDGAFLIMNSWGENWGKGGFTWVQYTDFCKTTDWAWELYVDKKSSPIHDSHQKNVLSGEFSLQLSTGETMPSKFVKVGDIPVYSIQGDYFSGSRYRAFISNNEPAYVYMIGSDLTNAVSKVFPPNDNISPALIYKSNHIAIPDEQYFIEMDNTVGTDYVCVLYSTKPLEINDIVDKVKNVSGTFYEKVNKVLGDKIVPASHIEFSPSEMSFNANSDKDVVALFVEISHK